MMEFTKWSFNPSVLLQDESDKMILPEYSFDDMDEEEPQSGSEAKLYEERSDKYSFDDMHHLPNMMRLLFIERGHRVARLPRDLLRFYIAPMAIWPMQVLGMVDNQYMVKCNGEIYVGMRAIGCNIANIVSLAGGYLVQYENRNIKFVTLNSSLALSNGSNQHIYRDGIVTVDKHGITLANIEFRKNGDPCIHAYDGIGCDPEIIPEGGRIVAIFREERRNTIMVWSGRTITQWRNSKNIATYTFRYTPVYVGYRTYSFWGLYPWGEIEDILYDHKNEER